MNIAEMLEQLMKDRHEREDEIAADRARREEELASYPGHSQLFNVARRKREGLVREVTCVTRRVEAWLKGDYRAWVRPLFAYSDN